MEKLVVFDFDGVLFPDTSLVIDVCLAVASDMGLAISKESLIKHWGKQWEADLLDGVIKDSGGWPVGKKEEFIIRMEKSYGNFSENPFPYIKEALSEIKADKAIISSRIRRTFNMMLESLEISDEFIFKQSVEDCEYTKPNPLVFSKLFDFISSNDKFYDQIWYVGDTLKYDYNAIKIYKNIKFVGVVSCLVSRQEFEKAGVSLIIDSVQELASIVNS